MKTAHLKNHLQTQKEDFRKPAMHNDISPATLLHLNVSVFRQLRSCGTSKARMCEVLNLNGIEYDYVNAIA